MTELGSIDLATVTGSDFEPHVNSEFTLRWDGGECRVTLIEVAEYPDHRGARRSARRRPFGLVFRCAAGALPQGTYGLEHSHLPSCVLFLSPFDGGEDWCMLEAIFN
jgi:hypothetical protein